MFYVLCAWVHDVLRVRIASRARKRTALRRAIVTLRTGAGITVVNGSKRMARLMGKDLPATTRRPNNDVGSTDNARALVRRVGIAKLPQPRESNFAAGRATAHQGPVGVAVLVVSPPLGE